MSSYVELNDTNFDQTVTANSGVVLVDFWASWCGPCRMLAPTIEQLAKDNQSKATVAKVNVDESEKLSQRFEVSSIPTIVVFKNGKQVASRVGVLRKEELQQMIDQSL